MQVIAFAKSFGIENLSGKNILTIDDRVCCQNVCHARSCRCESKTEGAQKRANYCDLSIGELLQEWAHKQPREIHHNVQHADYDRGTGCADIEVMKQITEQEAKRWLNGARGQL